MQPEMRLDAAQSFSTVISHSFYLEGRQAYEKYYYTILWNQRIRGAIKTVQTPGLVLLLLAAYSNGEGRRGPSHSSKN
jgi:hypothetical protein